MSSDAPFRKTLHGTKRPAIKKEAWDTVSAIANTSTITTTSFSLGSIMVVAASAFSRTGLCKAACWIEGGAAAIVNIIDCDAKTDEVFIVL